MSDSAFDVQNLKKVYLNGSEALKGVSLSVRPGEIFGLLGPNGAGKSTLINTLAGVVKKTSGELGVFGKFLPQDELAIKHMVGIVPQELSFDGFITVREALEFQSGYYGIRDNRAWIDELLKKLNLLDRAETNTRQLSGGMKRRLLVAKAMVHKPRLLVLDEPTAGVDIQLVVSLWNLVREVNRNLGTTIILTTHNLAEAEAICDRICIINHGEILALDDTRSLVRRLGDTRYAQVRFKGKVPALSHENLKIETDETNHSARIHYAEGGLPEVVGLLGVHASGIEDFRLKEDNLEDVFIRLVGAS